MSALSQRASQEGRLGEKDGCNLLPVPARYESALPERAGVGEKAVTGSAVAFGQLAYGERGEPVRTASSGSALEHEPELLREQAEAERDARLQEDEDAWYRARDPYHVDEYAGWGER